MGEGPGTAPQTGDEDSDVLDGHRDRPSSGDGRDGERADLGSDLIWWESLRDGEEWGFRELFARHHQAIYNFAFRRTTSWSQAEDIVQSTFTTLWRRAREGTLDPLRGDTCRPLLFSLAVDEMRNLARGGRRWLGLITRVGSTASREDHDPTQDWVESEHRMRLIRKELQALPEAQRLVIELVVWSELTMAQTADILGIEVGTVKSRLSRARQKLAGGPLAGLVEGAR